MSTLPGADDRRGFRAPGTTFMIAGGLIGAIGAYVFQVYGGRALGTDAFAPIGLLWTVFFILATVLMVPVEQYVTREVARGRKAIPSDMRPTAVITGLGCLIGGGFVWLTLDSLFEGSWQYIAQIVLLLVGYALLFFAKGVLAGRRRFAAVGWVLIVETVVRLVAGIVAIQLVASAESLGWAMVLGGFAVVGMRWWRHDTGESRAPAAPASKFLGGYVGGTAASQLLLAGAPIAVAALGADPAVVSVIFVTFTLYRAPLTLIFSLQGRILPYLVGVAGSEDNARLGRYARLVVVIGGGLSALGGIVGWLVGPQVVSVLYGDAFAPAAAVAAFAAAGVMAAATAQIASQVLVAEARTSRLASAWFGGLMIGLVALFVIGGAPEFRVALAFLIGEVVALLLMAVFAAGSRAPVSVLGSESGREAPSQLEGDLGEATLDHNASAIGSRQTHPD
jgi:O-antigen/teichoic acid export membrane protein